jgi:putative transposase
MEFKIELKYERKAHSVGGSFWHFQWCTKYRYKMFGKEYYRHLCTIFLLEASKRYKIGILAMSIQADHLHLVVKLPPKMFDSRALQLLKGFVSRLMFLQAPELEKRYPKHELWGDGNFSTTVGFVNLEETITYVKNQDMHHKLYV